MFPPGFQSSTLLGKNDPIQRNNFPNPARTNKSRRIGISLSLKEQHTQQTSRQVITVSRCLHRVAEWLSRLWRCKRQWENAEKVSQTGEWESAGLSGTANLLSSFLYGKMCQPLACQKEGPQTLPELRPEVRERKAKQTKASRRDLLHKAVKMDFMVLQLRKESGWKRSCLLLNFNADDGTRGHT